MEGILPQLILNQAHGAPLLNRKFQCKDCEYQATQKGHLGTHTKTVQMGLTFMCPECEYQASKKVTLVHHQQFVHMGRK